MVALHELPEEIYIEILERLPVKSLIRFKAVCKSWKSLISSPDFIDYHFDRSADNCSKLAIMIIKEGSKPDAYEYENKIPIFHTLDFSPTLSGETTKIEVPETMIPERRGRYDYYFKPAYGEPLSWCRGLLLLGVKCDHFSLLLWNPSTREYKDVPKPNSWRHTYEKISASDIGYDFTIRSHKIRGQLLQWIKIMKMPITRTPPKTLVNGAPHWVVSYYKVDEEIVDGKYVCVEKFNDEIEYFDFVLNKFVVVPQPGGYEYGNNYFKAELFHAEGRLCIGYRSSPKWEVWIMGEYGVDESWTKWIIFNVDIFGFPICFTRDMNVSLVGEKKIEGRSSRCFAIYNGETRGIELNYLLGSSQLTTMRAFTFVESLISIK
ncbi:hypothetical protein COLO4_29068 [Corchorus olitorius]|uniref:F-box domain-containing protein n=1 Tax=Corchorus olitorius TaxID=93759 RepID=A0A1R3HGH2_9ROSI|nr:hypothetical protein COLO4_29068 [Corchorus olitorius]